MCRSDYINPEWPLEKVIKGGYCIGCGACASLEGSPITIVPNEYGCFRPAMSGPSLSRVADQAGHVCPFAELVRDEDDIGRELFGSSCKHHPDVGYYLGVYAGYVTKDTFREGGSSGGITSWLLCELFDRGLVSGVIHVHPRTRSPEDPRLFAYQVSTCLEEIRAGAKTRYYPIEMSEVMHFIRANPGRYVFVGLPCYIKSVRLLMAQDPVLRERILFCVGLVCGHLKSMRFAEAQAWQCGIHPSELLAIDFRKKLPQADANRYGVQVTGLEGEHLVTRVSSIDSLYGSSWALGFFKYKACDYCDDVFGEVADVSIGDAWLPRYFTDYRGTNILVTRTGLIDTLVAEAVAKGTLALDRITVEEASLSQAGGLRHRREGLAYRLQLAADQGVWVPPKRIQPSATHLTEKRKRLYDLRIEVACHSHRAFKQALDLDDFKIFAREMNPLVRQYLKAARPPIWQRLKSHARLWTAKARKRLW